MKIMEKIMFLILGTVSGCYNKEKNFLQEAE